MRLISSCVLAVILGLQLAACSTQPSEPTDEELTHILPGGASHVLARESFAVQGRPYIAVVIGAPDYATDGSFWNVQAAIVTYRPDKDQWVAVWRSPERSTFSFPDEPPQVQLAQLTGPNAAWVLVDIAEPGASNWAHSFTLIQVGPDAKVTKRDEWEMYNAEVNIRSDEIMIEGSFSNPRRVIRLQGDDVEILTKGPSEVARQEAVNNGDHVVEFVLDGTQVHPVGPTTITVKAGDTIVFVPADESTRRAYDAGEITIYSDAWNGPPITHARAYELRAPSYTFTATGDFHFAFVYAPAADLSTDIVEPSLTVIVTAP